MRTTMKSAVLPSVIILAIIAAAIGLADSTDQCVTPAAGPLGIPMAQASEGQTAPSGLPAAPAPSYGVRPGGPAPDFEASGYYQGGFKNFKLSDYKGQWVVLCFYPGDFTFV